MVAEGSPVPRPAVSESIAPHEEGKVFLGENLVLLSGRSNPKLAHDIAGHLRLELQEPVKRFADGEPHIQIPKNLRSRNVVIVESTSPPAGEHFMDLLFLGDAVKRASGRNITAVVPYFGYARQDKKSMPREPISAAKAARTLEKGIDHIVTVDLHSEPVMGAFSGPWDNIYAFPAFLPFLEEWHSDDMIIVSPDVGGVKRAEAYAKRLGAPGLAAVYKTRDYSSENSMEARGVMGDVAGKDCVFVDDIIDTAGSLVSAAELLIDEGAKSVRAVATHGVLSEGALKRLNDSVFAQVVITDTIQQPEEVYESPKITVVSVAELLADAIRANETGESLSERGLFL